MKLRLEKTALTAELNRLFPQVFSFTSGLICTCQRKQREGYAIHFEGGTITIEYGDTDDLALALGDLMLAEKPAASEKIPPFTFRGIMLDVSRNAVVKIDFLKDRLARLALMGLNRFCLYTEDVYPVPGEPLFGYARGRYTVEELRDLVRYGKMFGVILFPCIQTLGHMEHILKYPHYHNLKDNDAVYNVHAEGVYAFIEKTIDAAIAPYDTDLIHVGMDETFGLGRGLAFRENEKIDPRRLYVEHVNKVAEICAKKKLKPIMWGDIVLGEAGEGGLHAEEARRLPQNVTMNYWNYALCDTAKYGAAIATFRKMGFDPVLSPGVWNWSRFFPAYSKAEANITALLDAGRRAGVRAALNTQWGDDGHEGFFDLNLPAHAYFLAACTESKAALAKAKKGFNAFCEADFDAVCATEKIEVADYRGKALLPPNVGKCFFYDDPAQGLFSGLPFVKPAASFYRAQAREMAAYAEHPGRFQSLFRFAHSFCDFLAVKCDLRRKAVAAYKKNDRAALRRLLPEIRAAIQRLKKVMRQYRAYWLMERSPFGLEIIEGRMGALEARLEYFAALLQEHLAGKRPHLEELEFKHYSMFHESQHPEYQPAIWPEFMLHYSALGSRNTIKWW